MELQHVAVAAIVTLGFLSLITRLAALSKWAWTMFLRPPKDLKEHYGLWALVTGPTDGIGRALALDLASRGLNLVLVGRDPAKLASTRQLIQTLGPGVSVRTVEIDFASAGGEEITRKIEEGIEGLDLGLVVNNAGVSPPARFFHEFDAGEEENSIKVNVAAATWVTRAVVPGMVRRRRGAIVNVGSGSSELPSYPLLAVYAATKSYIAQLSRCINLEYKQYGIDVQCQIPLLVATKMSMIRRSTFFIPSAETYSKASLRAIGYEQITVPYWAHSLQWCILRSLPEPLVDWLLLKYFTGLRGRLLKKQLRKEKQ
ncbi:Very-long-chain 3-oxoacyl-CoA reductase [Bertholletia excelsa]